MNAERAVKEPSARRFRASVVITGVALALFGLVTVAKHPASDNSMTAAASVVAANNAAGEALSMPVKEQSRLTTPGDVQADPRECEPAKGINTQCVFE
jgi:hypothetical protein